MASSGTPIVVPLIANVKPLAKGLKKSQKLMVGFGAAATAVVAKFAIDSVKEFATFDKGVREVATLLGDVTQQQINALSDDIREVSKAYGQAGTDVAAAFYDSLSSGVADESNVKEFAEIAARFATAGATEIGAGVDLLSSAMNAFQLGADQAGRVSDIFFSTVKAGKTTVDELSQAFFQVGPAASAAGISLEEASTWLAQLTLSGTPTKIAATQIKAALAEIVKPGTQLADTFEKVAGTTFPKFVASGGTLQQALQMVEQSVSDSGKSMFEAAGSIEAVQGLLGVTGTNAEKFAQTFDTVTDSVGATDTAFKVMAEGGAFQMAQFEATITDVKLAVGEALMPAIQALIPLVDKLEPLFKGVALVATFVAEALESLALTTEIATDTAGGAVEDLGSRTRTSFAEVTHDAEALEFMVKRNIGDRIPHHFEEGAKSAENLETRTRVSFGKIEKDIEATMFRGARSFERESKFIAYRWQETVHSFMEGAGNIGIALNLVTDRVKMNAESQRAALLAHIQGMDALHNQYAIARIQREQDVLTAVLGLGQDYAEQSRRQFLYASGQITEVQFLAGIDLANVYKDVWTNINTIVEQGTKTTTKTVVAEAEQLTSGLRVAMTNACGTVTGFQQCVDGVVVEYDADMNRILSDSDKLASGLRVAMTNACGTVTGFQKCVDGVVVEFDASGERIVSEAEQLASGIAVPMVNACGEITGFQQCVDGVVVEFDEHMNIIVDSANDMADGVGNAVDDAMSSLAGLSGTGGMGGPRSGYSEEAMNWLRGKSVITNPDGSSYLSGSRLGIFGSLQQSMRGAFEAIRDLGTEGGTASFGTVRSWLDSAEKAADIIESTGEKLGDIPFMAQGGIVRSPTLVAAGEDGPEAILPLDKMAGGMGGDTIIYNTFNIDPGLLSSPADVGERVEEVLNALTARKGRLEFVDAS